ncbi:MAG: 4-demethylwyosine synthase TYW1, partial [Candidatus Aenigmatarchaeota archaeon]
RMTLVKGLNFKNPKGYAKLISIAQPDYVEVKAFVFVGGARNPSRGLKLEDMPTMEEIREFAKALAEETNYIESGEHIPSRIVLLSKDEKTAKKKKIKFKK